MKTRFLLLCGGLLVIATVAIPSTCDAEQKTVTYSDSEAGKHPGDEATVTGKVASVTKSGKGTTYVNFGEKFPRQTFSGVVFAKDADAVGDLSQFEGKTVALTGRIELSPDGKPQIVITTSGQLKMADGTAPSVASTPSDPVPKAPSVPMPATPVPPATAASGSTTPANPVPKPTPVPKEGEGRRIALATGWASAPQSGEMTRKDLAAIFGSSAVSGEKVTPEESIIIYPDVPYLTPLAVARKNLHLENTNAGRTRIATPGMPVGSLTANAFPGIFNGGYTTLTLVTDTSDQVVSVHLTDSNPRVRTAELADTGGFHTYNFIALREKSGGQLVIKHELLREGAPAGVVVVDSLLIDPTAVDPNAPRTSTKSSKSSSTSRTRTGKILERSRWYVPKPLVNAILRASGNR